ncbi:hypothetical protein MVES1_001930 [Malassezia vespertilionis]|uniref:Rsc1p n=1 Tax=Malassezia vespertilionis TaxID=2020962 RepID=A0A2N1JCI0_9BASI|nr:uncharacterized protein MVES1_001930 [Malassezia vespertilionis]PKI84249.1 hypothetical protein MVES_001829 [Malassezia vespertilionis]WFD06578.1 hypothetical protein MVES1_001930 [Malassezia vespertilionis]
MDRADVGTNDPDYTLGLCVGSGEPTAPLPTFPLKQSDTHQDGWAFSRARDAEGMHRMFAQILHHVRDVEVRNVDPTVQGEDGLRVLSDPLEECPDPQDNPEYYTQIARPTSLSAITHRVVHCEYASPALFEQDMLQLFHNARTWYGIGTQGYAETVTLQRLYQQLTPSREMLADGLGVRHIKAKSNDIDMVDALRKGARATRSFASSNAGPGRAAEAASNVHTELADAAYKGRIYRVGDWVHVMNPVNPSRPIVAQIFRLYKQRNSPGTFFTASWYYRPEQTSHAETRLFAAEEVVKTDVFGEHVLEDIVEDVLVLSRPTYKRARPQAAYWNKDAPVYFVEYKYDTANHEFYKIKRWASCVPECVRAKHTPMDVFSKVPIERESSLLARRIHAPGFSKLLEYAPPDDEMIEYVDPFEGAGTHALPASVEQVPVTSLPQPLPATHPERLRAYASFHAIATDLARRMSAAAYAALQNALVANPRASQGELLALSTKYHIPDALLVRLRDTALHAGVLQTPSPLKSSALPSIAAVVAANQAEASFQPLTPSVCDLFRRDAEGNLLWYAAPPLDGWHNATAVRDGSTHVPYPSLDYLQHCVQRAK